MHRFPRAGGTSNRYHASVVFSSSRKRGLASEASLGRVRHLVFVHPTHNIYRQQPSLLHGPRYRISERNARKFHSCRVSTKEAKETKETPAATEKEEEEINETEKGKDNVPLPDESSSTNADANTSQHSAQGSEGPSTISKIADFSSLAFRLVVDNVKLAYSEMIGEGKESALRKKVTQADSFRPAKRKSEDGEEGEEGSSKADGEAAESPGNGALVLVKDAKGPWEQMKERLQDSPLIREMLRGTRRVGRAAAETDIGKQALEAGRNVSERVEDVREFWETSQNPIIYTLSGVWDSMTSESEEGIALREIRKLDPVFNKEDWAQEVRTSLAPLVIKAHLEGDMKTLRPWLGEAVFNKLAAEIRVRKSEGLVFDTNILDLDENQIIMRYLESAAGGPVIVVVYMVQQINCIRNKAGEIVEGGESEIRAKFYSMAFQQNYDDDAGIVLWKVVDYEFAGDIPYI